VREIHAGILGATGLVGQEVLAILEERHFPLAELRVAGSARSVGQRMPVPGGEVGVQPMDDAFFAGLDVVFSAVASDIARQAANLARRHAVLLIDKSSAFRMDPAVPLVVPGVNDAALTGHSGIVASPNCSTIQLVMALAPLAGLAPLASVEVATYQAVSGAGREAVQEMEREAAAADAVPSVFPKRIIGNVIPQVETFGENGYSVEEMKLLHETRKIMNLPELPLAATAVRVPVYRGHAEAVTVDFVREVPTDEAAGRLAATPGLRYVPMPDVPTPLDAAGNDLVWVGRLRRSLVRETALQLFIVSDNLRKGAATNAVQIAERALGL